MGFGFLSISCQFDVETMIPNCPLTSGRISLFGGRLKSFGKRRTLKYKFGQILTSLNCSNSLSEVCNKAVIALQKK